MRMVCVSAGGISSVSPDGIADRFVYEVSGESMSDWVESATANHG